MQYLVVALLLGYLIFELIKYFSSEIFTGLLYVICFFAIIKLIVLIIKKYNIYITLKKNEEALVQAEEDERKEKVIELARQQDNLKKKEAAEKEKKIKEKQVQDFRDLDSQPEPCTYNTGRHANESLAIRYGIVNQNRDSRKLSGESSQMPASSIRVQKVNWQSKDQYEVLLSDYGNRKAIAIIEPGTDYIKTFYPIDSSWFQKYADLELTLKSNGSFTLKELAIFHVQKTIL
jgi:hypothetical protein